MRVREQLVTSDARIFDGVNPNEYCTVHETANTNPGADAARHADLQSAVNVRQASWHEQVDDTEAVVSFPPEAQCWHAGDGDTPGGGNLASYAIEMCVNADGDYNRTVANTVERVRAWRRRTGHGRDRIVTHGHWSGKDCPSILLASGKWEQFVAATDPHGKNPPPTIEEEPSMSTVKMVSPVRGYTTSGYGRRGSGFHAGLDIATGGNRRAVYAAYAGTVERIVRGRKHGQPASRGSVLAPGRSGNGVIIRNPDGERQLYGHVNPLSSLRVGQRVSIGQRIGNVDLSGITTGLHVHFETWNSNRTTRNPMIDFRHWGVTPGAALPKGLPKSSGSSSSSSSGGSSSSSIEWPGSALRVDGDFGRVSARAYQRLLAPSGVGNYTGRIDGVFGPMSVRAEQRWLARLGFYSGRIDGQRGPMTIRALQRFLKSRGFYSGRIDGSFGPMSVRALQSYLNSQRQHYR